MTTAAPRRHGRTGRRPARHLDALRLAEIVTGVPTWDPPPSADVGAGITAWGMDGNATYADCVPAASDHYQVAKSAGTEQPGHLGGAGPVALYFDYGRAMGEPGRYPDEGVVIATWLLWLYRRGVIEGFCELDPTDRTEVHGAMVDYAGVLLGVELTEEAETLFERHLPWTLAGTRPTPGMGHGVLLVAYEPGGTETCVTWGALQEMTLAWETGCIQEAWVFVSSADAARTGITMAHLAEVIDSLGGTAAGPSVEAPSGVASRPVTDTQLPRDLPHDFREARALQAAATGPTTAVLAGFAAQADAIGASLGQVLVALEAFVATLDAAAAPPVPAPTAPPATPPVAPSTPTGPIAPTATAPITPAPTAPLPLTGAFTPPPGAPAGVTATTAVTEGDLAAQVEGIEAQGPSI